MIVNSKKKKKEKRSDDCKFEIVRHIFSAHYNHINSFSFFSMSWSSFAAWFILVSLVVMNFGSITTWCVSLSMSQSSFDHNGLLPILSQAGYETKGGEIISLYYTNICKTFLY